MRFGTRELLFVLVLLAMPLAAWFFVFSPRTARVEQARTEIAQKEVKLAQLEAATTAMDDLSREIDHLTQAIDMFEQRLPQRREVDRIVKEITTLSARQNLTVKSMSTDKVVGSARYSEQPIKLVIVGDFDGFYEFTKEIERLPRITKLGQMRLKKLRGGEEGEMQADLVLTIYFDGETRVRS